MRRAALLLVVLLAGCGGAARLGDGSRHGDVLSVDVTKRTLRFAPDCRGGRFTLRIAPHARLSIYFRPNGDVAAGHGQAVDLRGLAEVVRRSPSKDFPAGWTVVVRGGDVVSVEEDSGITAGGARPACR